MAISVQQNEADEPIPVGSLPDGVVYDGAKGYVYVSNAGSDNVTVINGTTNTIIRSTPVGTNPSAVTYDGANARVFVANEQASYGIAANLTVINGTSDATDGSISVGDGSPDDLAYDSDNGYVYVTNYASDNVTVVNGATGAAVKSIAVYTEPISVASDLDNGNLYVGIGSGIDANKVSVVSGPLEELVASIAVGSYPVGIATDTSNGYVYVANEYSDNVTVIDGASDAVVTSIPVGSDPSAVAYDSSNGYIYVANEHSDNVTLIDGTTDRVVVSVRVGSDPDALAYDGSNRDVYVTNRGSGSVSVITPSMVTPYLVTFIESGLPSGLTWSVMLAGATRYSANTTVTFVESNASYEFEVGSVPGYTANRSSGIISVDGANLREPLSFAATFLGLPATEGYAVLGGIVGAVSAAAVGGVVLARRRSGKDRGSDSSPG